MKHAPVWISGIGVVSAAGVDVASTLRSFYAGERNLTATLPFESSITCPTFQVAVDLAELPGRYNATRTLRLLMHAVRQALAGAGLDPLPAGVRVGVCLGTTVACQLNCLPVYAAYRRGEGVPLDPVYNYLNANVAQATAAMMNATGPRMTVVNACTSGADAIGVARQWLTDGLCDIAIAGGADELYAVPVAGFWSLGVMSGRPCAPFDRDRDGLNLGEGAGVLILESDAFARANDRRHGFQLAGVGAACDAHHLTAPHPEGRGLHAAVNAALQQAGVDARQVAFVNAHGTATPDNDRVEALVISRVFGPEIPVLSTKGFTGHTLGAAGGLEAAFALLGLREGWIPASPGFQNADADLSILPVRERTAIAGEYALSTSLAFGGANAAILIRRVA